MTVEGVTRFLEASSVTILIAFVAVLAVRTGLAERAAGDGDGSGWSRPTVVRRLDVVAVVLAVLGVGALVTIVVTGASALA